MGRVYCSFVSQRQPGLLLVMAEFTPEVSLCLREPKDHPTRHKQEYSRRAVETILFNTCRVYIVHRHS